MPELTGRIRFHFNSCVEVQINHLSQSISACKPHGSQEISVPGAQFNCLIVVFSNIFLF